MAIVSPSFAVLRNVAISPCPDNTFVPAAKAVLPLSAYTAFTTALTSQLVCQLSPSTNSTNNSVPYSLVFVEVPLCAL